MPDTILHAAASYRLIKRDGEYIIMEGLYKVTGFPKLHTLGEGIALLDELARCITCLGEKAVTCRTCQGDKRIYKYVTVADSSYRNAPTSIPCPDCLARGWTQCPRCTGSGIEPS